ncbi:hypothetical protein B566_EDAN010640 [Ephemera danica]|nr:hypothetical protein B566_EDAN010640 [Ephemera danica]
MTGLGAPASRLVMTLPAAGLRFQLQDPALNKPRSPALAPPQLVSHQEVCQLLQEGGWMVERDEDLTAPYAFRNSSWIAFDDELSVEIKSLVEPLVAAGNAPQLVPVSRPTRQISLSPYRVVRIVDRAGAVQVVRRDAQTEFECSRQGYYTHPQGYDYSVFEYDCPAGLAFDEKWEVCMWPGQARASCAGSSEIRPVPRYKFGCSAPGYYADPENCRWFFACMDHRRDGSVLTPYEFRCPYGLGFDERNLMCNWPWLVPNCANSYRESTFNALNSGVVGIGGIGIDQFLGVDPNNFIGNTYQGTSVNAQTANFGSPPRGSNNRNPYNNFQSIPQNSNVGGSPGQNTYQGSPVNSQGSLINVFPVPGSINNNAYQNQDGNPQVTVISGPQNPGVNNYQGFPVNVPTQQTPVSFAPALQVNNLGNHPQGLPPAVHVNNLGHNSQVPLTVIHPNVVNEQLHYTHPHTLVTPVPSFVVNPTPILIDTAHLGYAKQPRPLVGLTYPSRPVQPVVPQFAPQQPQTPVVQYPAPAPQYTTTPAPQVQQQNVVQQFNRPQTSVTYTQSQAPQRDQVSITGSKQTIVTNTQTFVDTPVTQSFLTSGIRESQFTSGPPGIQVVTTEAPTTTTSSPALTFSNLIINQDRNYERIIEEQRRQELQRQQQERIQQQQLQRERLQQQLERDRIEQQLREERLQQQREQQLLLIQRERQQQLLQQQQREREQQLLILERERQQLSQQTDRDRQPVINQFTITSVTRPTEFGTRLPSSQLTTTNNRAPIRNQQNSITILSPNDQDSPYVLLYQDVLACQISL